MRISAPGLTVVAGARGRGVYATRPFAAGDVIEVCPTLELPDADTAGVLGDYVFESGQAGVSLLVLGYGSLYNHAAEPNADYGHEPASGAFTFWALRAIMPGDEITITYGAEWWSGRDAEPV